MYFLVFLFAHDNIEVIVSPPPRDDDALNCPLNCPSIIGFVGTTRRELDKINHSSQRYLSSGRSTTFHLAELDLDNIFSAMKGRLIIDPYAILESEKVIGAGFDYLTLGSSELLTSTKRPTINA